MPLPKFELGLTLSEVAVPSEAWDVDGAGNVDSMCMESEEFKRLMIWVEAVCSNLDCERDR